MRAIIIGILITSYVANYHEQQKHGQPTDVQEASQHPPSNSAPAPVPTCKTATAQEQSAYQETPSYLKRAFGSEFLATWVLVIAAGIGLYVTWLTAKAAFLNAQAVIKNERPWVMLSSFDPPGDDYWSLIMKTFMSREPLNQVIHFRNFGNTPAWIVRSTAMLEICDEERMRHPFDYDEPPWNRDPRPLPQGREGAPFKIVVFLPAERILSAAEIQLLQSEQAFLLVYGYVWYQDPFFEQTKEIHKTYFSFRYFVLKAADGSIGGRWERYGGPGANSHS